MPSNPYHARITVPEHVLIRELDGEAVLLNLQNETYFGLDAIGMGMWQALTASESIQGAYDALLDEYDVSPEKLQQDLDALLSKLVEHGLLQVNNE